jgi:hypothetical protein
VHARQESVHDIIIDKCKLAEPSGDRSSLATISQMTRLIAMVRTMAS